MERHEDEAVTEESLNIEVDGASNKISKIEI